MRDYQNIVDALKGLKSRGFIYDFNLKPFCLECASLQLQLHPEDFEVTEVYRFEGMSSPDDNSVVYAIKSVEGVKGVLVDAYGAYAEALTPGLAAKLRNTNAS
ncbi:MAG: phosphoribosylpyrophosphate synthetase [Saprospiraceae bacterium]|nr:phosphoribosylpyrophosphate synthetase [Saprospiraceae bacterium]